MQLSDRTASGTFVWINKATYFLIQSTADNVAELNHLKKATLFKQQSKKNHVWNCEYIYIHTHDFN